MLIIHKRKKSLQDNEPETPMYNSKIENINNRNSQNNRKHFSLSKKTNSPIEKNHKYSPLKKLRIKKRQKLVHKYKNKVKILNIVEIPLIIYTLLQIIQKLQIIIIQREKLK